MSAAAVERGVLLRSIGDNVTLMPPLTITSEELHRIVHALSEAIDEVGDEVEPLTWDAWAEGETNAIRAAGRWREPRTLDAKGLTGTLGDDPARSCRSLPTTTSA